MCRAPLVYNFYESRKYLISKVYSPWGFTVLGGFATRKRVGILSQSRLMSLLLAVSTAEVSRLAR